MEHDDNGSARLPLLRSLLPPGYAAAQRELDNVFELAARDGRDNTHRETLHRWMSTLLKAEYLDELPGRGIARLRRNRRATLRITDE